MATFSSGATLNEAGEIVPVVDAVPTPEPPPPVEDTPPDAAGPAADGEPTPPDEPVSEDEAALSPEPQKPTRPFVARVIRENERYKRDLAAQAAQIEYLTRQLTQTAPHPPSQPAQVEHRPDLTKPRPDQYASQEEYVEALTDWKYDQREQQRVQREAQSREEQARQTAQQQWAQREAEGRDTYEDYDEVVSRLSLRDTIAPIVADTFRESEHGHALLYYLGKTPKDVLHLNSLTPLAAARWLGQLETRVAGPPAPLPRSTKPPAPLGPGVSPPATPPMQPVGTGGMVPLTGFRQGMSLGEYERMRQQQRTPRP